MGALECRGKLPNALRAKGVEEEEEEFHYYDYESRLKY
jgi:hypothetical protein